MIENPFHILILFLGVISLALALSRRFSFVRKVSPIILILFISAAFANLRIIRTDNPFYEQLNGYAVPFAVCLILMQVKISDFKKAGLPMLLAFSIGALGTLFGALAGGLILQGSLNHLLPGEGWKLAGPYIGTYIGGSVNFFAIWTGLEISNANLFAAANAVDYLIMTPIFLFWIVAPDFLGKYYPAGQRWRLPDLQREGDQPDGVKLDVGHLVMLSFTALLIMFVSSWIKSEWIAPVLPNLPSILILTSIALLVAQLPFVQRWQGAQELGTFAFYLFFAAVGAMMDIRRAVELAPMLFVYVVIILSLQVCLVLLLGKVLRLDIRLLAVAAVAAKAGPSSVIALTNAKGWNSLALPGVAAGILGYAIGNYIGFAGAYLMKFWIG